MSTATTVAFSDQAKDRIQKIDIILKGLSILGHNTGKFNSDEDEYFFPAWAGNCSTCCCVAIIFWLLSKPRDFLVASIALEATETKASQTILLRSVYEMYEL